MIYHDTFQNYKQYSLPPAQLILSDLPYSVGRSFYASNPSWWQGRDVKNGPSDKAAASAFAADENPFDFEQFFRFCSDVLKPEAKDAPCVVIFCAFEQIQEALREAGNFGFHKSIPLVFVKNYSPQVLKANMRIVGATEYGLVLYRNRLPKFRNVGEDGKKHMIFNWFEWPKDGKEIPRIHPAQKPISLLKKLIKTFTDEGDVVIDPCAGSGSTLRAATELGREAYGFEIEEEFYRKAKSEMLCG